jgi:hypothetical protein
MKTFNEYWKEKAQKRRKSWAAKAKRIEIKVSKDNDKG